MAEINPIVSSAQNTTRRALILTVLRLSIPAILAEISSVVMQYIDSAMVGSLGTEASASIGLVSTTTWLFGGLCVSLAIGFSVQAAQYIGAGRADDAADVFRQSLVCSLIFGLLLGGIGTLISPHLPLWLGGERELARDASAYFLVYSLALPFSLLRRLASNMLQSSGDMKTPSILNTAMCGMDVLFNLLLIFPSGTHHLFGLRFFLPGAGFGVMGAALGTALSEAVTAVILLYFAGFRSKELKFRPDGSWRLRKDCLATAGKIAMPVALERVAMCGAQVAATTIIAPLGKVSVAANSLAVTAESFCYMPGYGIGSAAATLVGQSIGAGERTLAKRYAHLSVLLGALFMTVTGAIMFVIAPQLFALLTPVAQVRSLGTAVLRIEAFAEPLYAVSIVASGALRGAGDTLVPGLLNLISMWAVRITASALLTPHFGLYGVWIAMCGELCLRGVLFLIRLLRGKWLQKSMIA